MAKNIIILGAGASAQYGAPVMGDFLDVARDLYFGGEFNSDETASFEKLEKAIASLQRAHSKSNVDLKNIESVLTLFEMAAIFSPDAMEGLGSIEETLDDFRRVIAATLFRTITGVKREKGLSYSEQMAWRPNLPKEIIELLLVIRARNQKAIDTAIITFNYDLLIDAIASSSHKGPILAPVDYGFGGTRPGSLPLLKMHGSLNWISTNDGIKTVDLTNHEMSTSGSFSDLYKLKPFVAGQYSALPGSSPNRVPLIIPPCWNKIPSYSQISAVWKRAASELSEAENIYVVGYSLPETDSFFRHLYSLGTVGDYSLRNFSVYSPDASVFDRFRSLLGPGAIHSFNPIKTTANEAFRAITAEIAGQVLRPPRLSST